MASKAKKSTVPVTSLKHADKRRNIPTEELRDFVAAEEKAPKTMLYPRDPSLDPQLVWKGKDKQDAEDLKVPVVPIYIQEKIHPQAIIEQLRAEAQKDVEPQADLFGSAFNGLTFEREIEFYQHDKHWANRMILGDSLMVMTSLTEKEGLKGKVQMIYIDPPYGIEFGSNWQVSTRKRVVKDGRAEDASREPEVIKAFRDTWALGIHSYLAFLRDRLAVAHELLTNTGSIFIQIGDDNLHLVRCLLDEVFGAENAKPVITFRKKMMPLMKDGGFEPVCDYILWYQKNKEVGTKRLKRLFEEKHVEGDSTWGWAEISNGERRKMTSPEIAANKLLPNGARIYSSISMLPREYRPNQDFKFEYEGKAFPPPKNSCWSTTPDGMRRLAYATRLQPSGEDGLRYVYFHSDYPVARRTAIWMDTSPPTDMHYVVETNVKVVERVMLSCTDPGDLVLDPTCGSGTTAYVAEHLGRRWITVDSSRVALALARTRLMAAKFPYYVLADTPAGFMKEAETTGYLPPDHKTEGDIKKGFVYRRVPHIQLGSIANNPDIDPIHERWQKVLDPLRVKLNKMLGVKWEEWEIPRESEQRWKAEAQRLLDDWWNARRARQQEIDAAIAKHADFETLYDQPYEDGKRIRVSGPFTVESLSPHRVLPAADKMAKSPEKATVVGQSDTRGTADFAGPTYRAGDSTQDSGNFVSMLIENMRRAGVKGAKKDQRIAFDRLEAYAGTWIHSEGEFTDADGKSKRVAVCFGPEFGTVGPELLKEAAKEAVQGIGFDVLLVCGFAFDPHVSEEAQRYGKLTVLPTRMNPDLAMGDELLKKTGAGNLFMVFGEPDVDIKKGKDGKLTVEIKGLDVYDPTTGQIRSNSTDDIACWFIDTSYNSESFFVRHAYFTGADKPFERLQKALRAELNSEAWESIYSTKSRPFDPPKTKKIAIKVINHYGDEVLKVFEVDAAR